MASRRSARDVATEETTGWRRCRSTPCCACGTSARAVRTSSPGIDTTIATGYGHPRANRRDRGRLVAELVVRPGRSTARCRAALLAVALEPAEAAARTCGSGRTATTRPRAVLAEHLGFRRDRILLQMRRLTARRSRRGQGPDGVVVRTFRPGEDDEAWVALNAAAFAGHPEQAYVTLDDLRERHGRGLVRPRRVLPG